MSREVQIGEGVTLRTAGKVPTRIELVEGERVVVLGGIVAGRWVPQTFAYGADILNGIVRLLEGVEPSACRQCGRRSLIDLESEDDE